MNYKTFTIHGKHGCGFRVVDSNVCYTFNKLTSAKDFIDGITAKRVITKETLFIQYAPAFNFEYDADQVADYLTSHNFYVQTGVDEYLEV